MSKANKIYYKGIAATRSESTGLLEKPGDFALVKRGIPRLLILRCPCGCGDELLINLDKRAGPAWRLYLNMELYSLFPSYWRDTKCGSHFIIWNNKIYWFHKNYRYDEDWNVPQEIENEVLKALKMNEFTHYIEIADECGLIPWECLQACKQLSEKGLCESNDGIRKEYFKKSKLHH